VGLKLLGPVEIRTQDRPACGLVTILTELSRLQFHPNRTQDVEVQAQIQVHPVENCDLYNIGHHETKLLIVD